MPLRTYFDFAENDYLYFMASCERGDVANMMGAIAQGICEKYMKHLIEEFDQPVNEDEVSQKEKALHSHSLNRLLKHIQARLGVDFSTETKKEMRIIDGFYFSTRYPGDESIELSREDVEDCCAAVQSCRKETLEWIERLSVKDKPMTLEEKIEAARIVFEAQDDSIDHVFKEEQERG